MESSTSSIPIFYCSRAGRTPSPRLLASGSILAIHPEGPSLSSMSRMTFTTSDHIYSCWYPATIILVGSPPSQEINPSSGLELGTPRDAVTVGVLQHGRYFLRSRYRVIFYAAILFRTPNSSFLAGLQLCQNLWNPQDLGHKFIAVLVRDFGGYCRRYFFCAHERAAAEIRL